MMGAQFYKDQGGGFYNDASGTKASLPVYKELLETTGSAIADACRLMYGKK